MTGPSAERALLAVALGSAAGAYAGAFVAPLPLASLVGVAFGVVAWSGLYRSRSAQAAHSLLAAVVRILLLTTGLIAVFSKDVPVLAEGVATTACLLTGGALIACALTLAWRGPAHPRHTGLVPVVLGVLVTAGLQPGARHSFAFLACVSGASLWAWALVVGGPRRAVLRLTLFLVFGGGLAWGAVLFLPWAQPHVEEWVAGAYADGRTGLSNRSELGEVRNIARSRRIVARVWTTKPQLLRMQVFTTLAGNAWTAPSPRWRDAALAAPDRQLGPLLGGTPGGVFRLEEGGGPGVETRVIPRLAWDDGWGLLLPARPARLRLPAEKVRFDDDTGLVDLGSEDVNIYAASSEPSSSPPSAPPAEDPARVPVPDEEIRRLADRLGPAGAMPREKLDRTVAYLTTHYRYTLEGLPTSLHDFLFQRKAGYCEYFAAAAVMLLRYQGVPARYVKGVRVDPTSEIRGHYVIRESDTHAWIEAYLPGEGWVEADPTPAATGAANAEATGPMVERWEALESWLIEARIRLEDETWPELLAGVSAAMDRARDGVERRPASVAGVLAALGIAVLIRRLGSRGYRFRLRPARNPPDDDRVPVELRDLLRRMERRWARSGRPRPAARGLREHLEALPTDSLGPGEREAAARLIAAYYAVRYGDTNLTEDALADLRARSSMPR